jgi:hypothetical protein
LATLAATISDGELRPSLPLLNVAVTKRTAT